MTGAGELAMFLAVGAAAVGLLFGPIGAAVARRIGGRADSEVHAEIDAVRDGLTADVDQLRGR